MNLIRKLICVVAMCMALTSCAQGDFTLEFPGGYLCQRIAADWHVMSKYEPNTGANVVVIDANVDMLGYVDGVVIGHVSKPSDDFAPHNPKQAGYFVIAIALGEVDIGLDENALGKRLEALKITSVNLKRTEEFASDKNPMVRDGVLHKR